jgi:hypothetical protein
MRLRIESVNGSPVNDYRIRDGRVEVRMLDPSGREYAGPESRWRMLDANEIQLHYALGTIVSKWMERRLQLEDLRERRAA